MGIKDKLTDIYENLQSTSTNAKNLQYLKNTIMVKQDDTQNKHIHNTVKLQE